MATRHPPTYADPRGTAPELMANRRRRHALSYLQSHSREEISVDDLLSQVIARELLVSDEPVDPESVGATLRHVHLPKLAEAGLIEYDPESDVVSALPAIDGGAANPSTEYSG